MPLDKALRLSAIVLAAAALLSLALSSTLPEWLVGLAGASLIVVLIQTCGFTTFDPVARHVKFSPTAWNIVLTISFLGFLADMQWISGALLPAGVHFLAILMVVKLFTLRLRRDHIHLYVVSLMAILASASSTTDLWYLPVFGIYLLSAVWTLLLLHLARRWEEPVVSSPPAQLESPQCRLTPGLFWLANGLSLGVFVVTLAIFFAIPRVNAGFLQSGAGESIRTSGFSDTVNLGAIGPVKRDPSIVMRVEVLDPASRMDQLYLRGVTYDRYDGMSWTNQFTHRQVIRETAPMVFTVRQHSARAAIKQGPILRQKILLESLDTAVLFAAPFAESVSGPFLTVQSDIAGALYRPFPSSSRIEYSVVSRMASFVPSDEQAQPIPYVGSFVRHYLQVPGQSERVAALAEEITRNQSTIYEKAVAIEKYLSRNFRYSLDVPIATQQHPLEDFLFTRKTGYCEHYATAMVIMLRSVGIPARLVTGFLATEWNEYGNYFLVRQQDAHAWVELHLPQAGWINMDPTPAVTAGVAASGWQTFGQMMDHMRLRWNRLFVQYSGADQMAVVREVKAGSASLTNQAWSFITDFLDRLPIHIGHAIRQVWEGNLPLLGQLVSLVLAAVAAMVWLKMTQFLVKGPHHIVSPQEQAITRLYQNMVDQLSRQGVSKSGATPPLEFLSVIRQRWKTAEKEATIITELYCRVRFGQASPTEDELRLAQDSLRQLLRLKRSSLLL